MPPDKQGKFELPRKIEKILASLSVYYAQNDKPLLQKIIVNSRSPRVHEEYDYDNWNGGTWGHAVYFQVPAAIYYEIFDNLYPVARELCEGINRISNVQNECISEVFLELEDDPSLENWRENSGVLLRSSPAVIVTSDDQLLRLWEPRFLRVFLSHKAEYKKQAFHLKEASLYYGISCFVAHEDIEPTKKWQDEIERALFSMDAMVLLLTEGFSNSNWTDQEVGVAIGRRVPVVSVQLGTDPYRFIGKYQAVAGHGKAPEVLAKEIFEVLFDTQGLNRRVTETLVQRFERSNNFNHANDLMKYIKKIENATPEIIDRLEKAAQSNPQVKGAFDVQDELPSLLKRLRDT